MPACGGWSDDQKWPAWLYLNWIPIDLCVANGIAFDGISHNYLFLAWAGDARQRCTNEACQSLSKRVDSTWLIHVWHIRISRPGGNTEKNKRPTNCTTISHFTSVDVHKIFHKTHVIQVDYGDHRQALRPFSRTVNMCFTFLYGRPSFIGFPNNSNTMNSTTIVVKRADMNSLTFYILSEAVVKF